MLNAPIVASHEIVDPLAFSLELSGLDRNDQGNARRFVARAGGGFLYVSEVAWAQYDGARWNVEGGEDAARRAIHAVFEDILDEVAACRARVDDAKAELEEEDDDERRKKLGTEIVTLRARSEELFKWKIASGNRARYESGLDVARPYLTIAASDFDPDPFAINVANGTLRVRMGPDGRPADDGGDLIEMRPHAREDRISRVASCAYDPKARCPTFDAFLARVQPDASVRAFLQRFLGYALTGVTTEQVMLLNIGEGANGKSTLFDLVASVVGGYGATIDFASLTRDDHKRGGEPTPDLARLPGVRFLRTSEPDEGVRLGEALIKQVTGGEPITVRHLNKGFFEFKPEFKLIVSGNHRPNIRGQDLGIWRRVLLVPWDVIIPKEERDRDLGRKLLEEAPGVLNWLLDGVRLYAERGLEAPDAIRAATEEYRQDSDPLGQFIAQCVVKSPGMSVLAREMYDAYARWCRESAVNSLKETSFARRMSDRGFSRRKTMTANVYDNVYLQNIPTGQGGRSGEDLD
ncbi:phage/plasmid primase, P4 family [Methylopila musalis]|uniref:Phage/plasmid primase, P4 family n=1 Tax=Methylopila musalis TaxID=1134781 RepID=A0ABW3Z3J5_9HYPH